MNALQQRLDMEPALPQGFPARRPIAPTSQIPTQVSDRLPEIARRHPVGGLTCLGSHKGEQICLDHLVRGSLRLDGPDRAGTQTDRQGRQQSQQADEPVCGLDLAGFDPAPGFETLVIVLNNPAVFIPSDPFPCLRHVVVGTEVNRIHSNGFLAAGGWSSQTRMAQTH